jgi:superfamily II DNA or RNA helicase
MIIPREYQVEALDAVSAYQGKGITRQLISLPTGTGKTVIFALLAKQRNVKTLVLAHREELLTQASDKLQMIWPESNIGLLKADLDESSSQIVIASIQTVCRDKRLESLKQHDFGLMIVDECHHAAAESYIKVIKELGFLNGNPSKLLLGVTATVSRGDGLGLGEVFEEIVFERSISTMVRAGYLTKLVGKSIVTKLSLDGVGVREGDYVTSELSKLINTPSRNELIIDNIKLYAADRKKMLVFCADVEHACNFADALKKEGVTAEPVFGAMDAGERKRVLREFNEGKIQMLTNCMVLTEGFDQPDIDCVVMARPTKSKSLYMQMIGRGTRLFPTKKDCLILDFCDNSSKNDLVNYKNCLKGVVAPLLGVNEDDDVEEDVGILEEEKGGNKAVSDVQVLKERVEDIEFFDKAHFAWVPVGDSWHLQLATDRDVWVRQVKGGFLVVAQSEGQAYNLSSRPLPLDYALGVAEDWGRKQTTKNAWARKDAAWRSQPATPKQLETLTRSGCRFDYGISKGEAAQLLDSKFNEPATSKQLCFLRCNGVSVSPSITKIEACKLIAGIKGGQNVQR